MSRPAGVTLCSVSFRSREFLLQNRALTARLNPQEQIQWLVIENSPPGEPSHLAAADDFTVIPGQPSARSGKAAGSYHHGAALNAAVRQIKTRYVAILDPDFFVIRPGWIQGVQQFMAQRGLSFFGSPYFPDRWFKYRYFPCGIFMWIDLDQVNPAEIDFTPEVLESDELSKLGLKQLAQRMLSVPADLNRTQIVAAMEKHVFRRSMHDETRMMSRFVNPDVGIRVYRRYAGDVRRRAQCLTCAWENPLYVKAGDWRTRARQLALRALVPDRWLRAPRRKSYTTASRFRDSGHPDLAAKGWEEYFWGGQPFGFHVRGVFQGLKTVDPADLAAVLGVLPN